MDLSELISPEDMKQFRLDVGENLSDLEQALLGLEASPEDRELMGAVFRAMHTIKGASGMYGFEEAAGFTHHVENLYDRLRNGELSLTREIIDNTLVAKDLLQVMLLEDGGVVDAQSLEATLDFFLAQNGAEGEAAPEETCEWEEGEWLHNVHVRFKKSSRVFDNATNPLTYLECLSDLSPDARVICHTDQVPPLEELDPGHCFLHWDVILSCQCSEGTIRDELIFILDDLEEPLLHKRSLSEMDHLASRRLGEILVERGAVTDEDVQGVLQQQRPVGKLLAAAGKVSESQVASALAEQSLLVKKQQVRSGETSNHVRVPSEKLDVLVNQVGEMVIAQARLTQLTAHLKSMPELITVTEEIARLTDELRDSAMAVRMMPIASLFSRFNRLVRDLSRELGKDVALLTEGGETELDKTVIDNLYDPLVHLLRNAIDHGVESGEKRRKQGKAEKGTITLSAIHSGANVLIRIRDDGNGLDVERIRKKAVASGIIAEDAAIPAHEIHQLIFAAGFSTAEKVTSVSGRGVGMDVVKRAIEDLRGSVEVESTAGKGTAITIKLPLTLAIIDGFLVQSAKEQYVLPLSTVKECVKLTAVEVARGRGERIINIRGQIVPYVRLREVFHLRGDAPLKEQVVITEIENSRVGLVVDEVIGQSQVVIKSLGDVFKHVAEFSGATILGDGRVVPIIDVARFIAAAKAA